MEDLIALLVLAIESVITMLVAHYIGMALPWLVGLILFIVLTFIGLGVWDSKAMQEWRKFALNSLVLSIGFFGVDVLLAHLHGQTTIQFGGDLLGLPLIFVIWCCAMVSLAGFARAPYIRSKSANL